MTGSPLPPKSSRISKKNNLFDLLDFHIHIARLPRPEEISRALVRRGYKAVLVACEPWEWERIEALLPLWKDSAIPCFGIHPMIAANLNREELAALRSLLHKYPQAFVGECGLDKRFPGYAPGEIQESVFQTQAEMALEMQRPLMLHSVGDSRRLLKILEGAGFSPTCGQPIFHRFSGDAEIVKRAMALNALFSLHLDSFRKKSFCRALPLIPAERIRFETDADESFLMPSPEALESNLQECVRRFEWLKMERDSENL